jgi:hypothetical protein
MIPRFALLAAFALQATVALAANPAVWEGGLWIVDYEGDISTYGYFRVLLEPSLVHRDCSLLRVEWIERVTEKRERVFATRLISEPELCLNAAGLRVADNPELPDRIEVWNSEGRRIELRLLEPTKFEIRETGNR